MNVKHQNFSCNNNLYSIFAGKNCVEFNFGGFRIQRNEKVKCSECPMYYASNDSFQCKIYVTCLFTLHTFCSY